MNNMKRSLMRALVGVIFGLSLRKSVEYFLVRIFGAGKGYVDKIFGLE